MFIPYLTFLLAVGLNRHKRQIQSPFWVVNEKERERW